MLNFLGALRLVVAGPVFPTESNFTSGTAGSLSKPSPQNFGHLLPKWLQALHCCRLNDNLERHLGT